MTLVNAGSGRGESGRRIETVRPVRWRRRLLRAGLTALAAAVLGVPAYAMAAPSPSPTGGGSVDITVEIAPSPSPSRTGSPSPTQSTSPSQTPTHTPPHGGGGNLAKTGLSLVSFLAAGVLLVAVGISVRVLARRRSAVSKRIV